MKKVLFASTALVASATLAAAEVKVTGSAEMGIFGGENAAGVSIQDQFFQDIDVTFTLSGTTDNGLTFGASVDLDEAQDSCTVTALPTTCTNNAFDNPAAHGGVAIFVSGDFGTLTMGDTDGALDWALTDAGNMGNPGSIADDETTHAGYLGAYLDGRYDGQIVRYDNTFAGFGVALSVEMDDTGVRDTGYAIGTRYNWALGSGNVAFGAGYQSTQDAGGADRDAYGVSAVYTMDAGLTAGVEYTQFDLQAANADFNHVGVGVGYKVGALSMHANYGKFDYDNGTSADGYGVAVGYDLGGGASLLAGYGSGTNVANVNRDTYSFGLSMAF